jgi:DNA-binding response OmpR family regulator
MSRNSTKKKIVIAEDDDAVLELVTVRLELAGYHTVAARNGFQALERIRAIMPDGLILDIGMPQLDGFGVLQELRKRSKKLPVCVLTARHSTQDVQRAVMLGANCYVAKPFDDKTLLERVARMLLPATPVGQVWEI